MVYCYQRAGIAFNDGAFSGKLGLDNDDLYVKELPLFWSRTNALIATVRLGDLLQPCYRFPPKNSLLQVKEPRFANASSTLFFAKHPIVGKLSKSRASCKVVVG